MLKGGGIGDVAPEYLALAVILTVITVIAVLRYRRTLD